MKLKNFVRECCPPFLWRQLKAIRGRKALSFQGSYESWEEAYKASTGYDTEDVFLRVGKAAMKVAKGEALFERDSVCFNQPEYRWPVLACLLSVAAKCRGEINVLDFGGSLGSFYFQHEKFFVDLPRVNWAVVEQGQFVEFGRDHIRAPHLHFYDSARTCLQNQDVDVILLSSVLQYLEKPYEVLQELAGTGARYLLIDRTSFVEESNDRLTVQQVPEAIYKATYPAWFFSRAKFDRAIEQLGFRMIAEFPCEENAGFGTFKGAFFERK